MTPLIYFLPTPAAVCVVNVVIGFIHVHIMVSVLYTQPAMVNKLFLYGCVLCLLYMAIFMKQIYMNICCGITMIALL